MLQLAATTTTKILCNVQCLCVFFFYFLILTSNLYVSTQFSLYFSFIIFSCSIISVVEELRADYQLNNLALFFFPSTLVCHVFFCQIFCEPKKLFCFV